MVAIKLARNIVPRIATLDTISSKIALLMSLNFGSFARSASIMQLVTKSLTRYYQGSDWTQSSAQGYLELKKVQLRD